MAYIHHDTCAVYVTSRIGTTGMPANRSIMVGNKHTKLPLSVNYLVCIDLWWWLEGDEDLILAFFFFFLLVLLWISASVTDTLLFASVTSWLSSNPISRVIFSPWPLTPISLSHKTIKSHSLILPVSHAKFFSLKLYFLLSQHLVSVIANYLKIGVTQPSAPLPEKFSHGAYTVYTSAEILLPKVFWNDISSASKVPLNAC